MVRSLSHFEGVQSPNKGIVLHGVHSSSLERCFIKKKKSCFKIHPDQLHWHHRLPRTSRCLGLLFRPKGSRVRKTINAPNKPLPGQHGKCVQCFLTLRCPFSPPLAPSLLLLLLQKINQNYGYHNNKAFVLHGKIWLKMLNKIWATKWHEYGEMKMKKMSRYLLFPPHLSSPFLLPLCLLQFWLSWLSWSWLCFCGLLRLRPPSQRTPPRTLSSCHEHGLNVNRGQG